jgi:1-acyl-sn-glycerol-3-phosphate acyltransferase
VSYFGRRRYRTEKVNFKTRKQQIIKAVIMTLNFKNLDRSFFVFSHTLKYLKMAEAPNANYLQLKSIWAHEILKNFHIHLEVIHPKNQHKSGPIIYVGNHISYMDIIGLICTDPQLAFVSKKEVKYFPVIGTAAERDNTIFVKRENKKSRGQSRKQIAESLLKNNGKIVIFPSGTTTLTGHRDWRYGAFQIAHENQIPIQPFRLLYNPLRVAAYIDNDSFAPHLWRLAKEKHIDLKIEFHKPIQVSNPIEASQYWQKWSESILPSQQN